MNIMPECMEHNLNRSGYRSLHDNVFVSEEDAFDYAVEQCIQTVPPGLKGLTWTDEFRDMMVEWFYSGDWIKEDSY